MAGAERRPIDLIEQLAPLGGWDVGEAEALQRWQEGMGAQITGQVVGDRLARRRLTIDERGPAIGRIGQEVARLRGGIRKR